MGVSQGRGGAVVWGTVQTFGERSGLSVLLVEPTNWLGPTESPALPEQDQSLAWK